VRSGQSYEAAGGFLTAEDFGKHGRFAADSHDRARVLVVGDEFVVLGDAGRFVARFDAARTRLDPLDPLERLVRILTTNPATASKYQSLPTLRRAAVLWALLVPWVLVAITLTRHRRARAVDLVGWVYAATAIAWLPVIRPILALF
jgi:hypothetical protein